MDIVINYSTSDSVYKIYEPTSDTLLLSKELSEGLLNLNTFLKSINKIPDGSDLLSLPDIEYHLDSHTMVAIVKSNVDLLKRLRQGPSEFKLSNDRFGKSSGAGSGYKNKSDFANSNKNFRGGYLGGKGGEFGKSRKKWMK